jgi:predicted metal-dependent phosphoesterase TrpH
MIDLHAHTDRSDGTLSPRELVEESVRVGLGALAITNHDTFAGSDETVEYAARALIELICGVELSTKYRSRSVHPLAYFLKQEPTREFRNWVTALVDSRHRHNLDLVEELCARGLIITIEEVSERAGKIVARPHAALMVGNGFVLSEQQALDEYLGECGASLSRETNQVSKTPSLGFSHRADCWCCVIPDVWRRFPVFSKRTSS